jgi:hypothetical protein
MEIEFVRFQFEVFSEEMGKVGNETEAIAGERTEVFPQIQERPQIGRKPMEWKSVVVPESAGRIFLGIRVFAGVLWRRVSKEVEAPLLQSGAPGLSGRNLLTPEKIG